MLNLLLTAGLLLAPYQEAQEGPEPPDPAVVAAAIAELEAAFDDGKAPERIAAIEAHAEINDAEVVKWIEKGFKDKDAGVKAASIEAFRWLPNAKALKALHTALQKDKTIKKDEALYAELVKAIGQHGDASSIDILLDGATASTPKSVSIARIYSLGHIRDKRSVEELMDLMKRTGGVRGNKGGGRGGQPMMAQFQASLHVLTGENFGRDEQAWTKWWKEHGKDFEVADKATGLDPKIERAWTKYWSKPKEAKDDAGDEKKKRRRGGDDPTDGEDVEGA